MPETQELIQEILRGDEIFKDIRSRWFSLSIPSYVLMSDVGTCILLAKMKEEGVDIDSCVKSAAETLARLREERDIKYILHSSDAATVMALAILSQKEGHGSINQEVAEQRVIEIPSPLEVSPPISYTYHQRVDPCPHCGHDIKLCEQGEYKDEQEVEAQVAKEPGLSQDSQSAQSCIHVGSDNKCVLCTDEEVIECYNCEKEIIASKAIKCKNYDQCERALCDDCREENINERGYCEECGTISCSFCDNDIEVGSEDEHHCGAGTECEDEYVYCSECSPRLLNKDGLCPSCSGDEEWECDGCEETFTSSLHTECKNFDDCKKSFCDNCKDGYLLEGLCEECREEG